MRTLWITGLALLLGTSPLLAAPAPAPMAVHLLDYIGVDYSAAVTDGQVVNELEYAEMKEFGSQVQRLLTELPPKPEHNALVANAEALTAAINTKATPETVRELANSLRHHLIDTYNLPTLPDREPDLAQGEALYETNCASCHGLTGQGDGAAGAGLEPPPSNFHDAERMAQRGVYSLYNTITLGVDGTGMGSYAHLSADDRWALAYHVANFAAKPPLALARDALTSALDSYRTGDRNKAINLSVHAYLDGFELVEAAVQVIDTDLMRDIEAAMMQLRAMMRAGKSIEEVDQHGRMTLTLLDEAETRLKSSEVSNGTTFTGALLILLREGLEAILVVAALLAVLSRSGRADARRWVHAGWITALALGIATWLVSEHVLQISGASREITEGVTALIASAMLLYVGYWLHSRSKGAAWQQFINGKVGNALGNGTLWTLTLVSFLAVYREAFETVLFFQVLNAHAGPGGTTALLAGFATGVVLLLGISVIIARASVRLPIGVFFSVSGILLMALAFVFAGQGIAALQEAGRVGMTHVPFFAAPSLGIHPTLQSLAAQAFVLIISTLLLWRNRPAAQA